MKYWDYILATDGEVKVLCLAPGFSRLKEGDMVKFPGSDWFTVVETATLGKEDEAARLLLSIFGEAVSVTEIARVEKVDYE